MMKIYTFLVLLILSETSSFASPIEDAYQAIPHKQTTYRAQESPLSASEALNLSTLFSYVDRAIVLRVAAMQSLSATEADAAHRGGKVQKLFGDMDSLSSNLSKESMVEKLLPIRAELLEAMREQKLFLQSWDRNKDVAQNIGASEIVQSSHKRLFDVYGKLIALYPQESSHNKQAFFDHLCALDFI